jgi:hypothetical protein
MSYYTITYGQSLIDVSVKLFDDASYTFDLINWNSSLVGIDDADLQGLEIYYEPIVKSGFKSVVTSDIIPLKSVTIKQGQSIFDVSLQLFGTTERIFEIVDFTGVVNLDSEIVGKSFSYVFENKDVPTFLNTKGINLATATITESGDFIWDGFDIIWDGTDSIIY